MPLPGWPEAEARSGPYLLFKARPQPGVGEWRGSTQNQEERGAYVWKAVWREQGPHPDPSHGCSCFLTRDRGLASSMKRSHLLWGCHRGR